ncbi:MAG TPA: response regulator transcription factor [Ferruginibacter sp.]|nr:response regulator transcription factor [Ferruginibacter sp.]HMP22230.1 response regulator transcription factor [Ferruginibacter sp.]
MEPCTILYVEDDDTLAFLTKDNLEAAGCTVLHYRKGEEAVKAFGKNKTDLCIFDIMLPGMDGFELATAIRKLNKEVPILFLSAKTLPEDRIKGFKSGADDYIVKPFSIEELLLKIEVFLQRRQKKMPVTKIFKAGSLEFDPVNFTIQLPGEKVVLTQREAALLQLFFENAGKVLTREQILTGVWGVNDYFLGRSMDVFVSRLRKIVAKEPAIRIETLHGIGFKCSVAES